MELIKTNKNKVIIISYQFVVSRCILKIPIDIESKTNNKKHVRINFMLNLLGIIVTIE